MRNKGENRVNQDISGDFYLESDRIMLYLSLEHAEDGGGQWYTIIDKNDNMVIGSIGMVHLQPEWKNMSIQVFILEEERRREGYGTEALELLEEYIFDVLGYHRIAVKIADYNEAAIGLFKKAGYKLEGVQEQGGYRGNRYYDFILMRLLQNEYVKRNEKRSGNVKVRDSVL